MVKWCPIRGKALLLNSVARCPLSASTRRGARPQLLAPAPTDPSVGLSAHAPALSSGASHRRAHRRMRRRPTGGPSVRPSAPASARPSAAHRYAHRRTHRRIHRYTHRRTHRYTRRRTHRLRGPSAPARRRPFVGATSSRRRICVCLTSPRMLAPRVSRPHLAVVPNCTTNWL